MAWGLGVDGRLADGLQSPHRAPKALCGSCDARDGERIRSRGLSRPGWREIAGTLVQLQAGRQAGNGMACSWAKARVNRISQGQRRGRCKVRRRAERVIRPTRAKTRRLRVLVITVRSPRPIRAVRPVTMAARIAPTCATSPPTGPPTTEGDLLPARGRGGDGRARGHGPPVGVPQRPSGEGGEAGTGLVCTPLGTRLSLPEPAPASITGQAPSSTHRRNDRRDEKPETEMA